MADAVKTYTVIQPNPKDLPRIRGENLHLGGVQLRLGYACAIILGPEWSIGNAAYDFSVVFFQKGVEDYKKEHYLDVYFNRVVDESNLPSGYAVPLDFFVRDISGMREDDSISRLDKAINYIFADQSVVYIQHNVAEPDVLQVGVVMGSIEEAQSIPFGLGSSARKCFETDKLQVGDRVIWRKNVPTHSEKFMKIMRENRGDGPFIVESVRDKEMPVQDLREAQLLTISFEGRPVMMVDTYPPKPAEFSRYWLELVDEFIGCAP